MAKKTIWSRNYTLVFLVNILNAFSFHILAPTIPKYVVSIGNGVEIAGFAATAFTVMAILTRPFAGYYVNIRRKKIVLCTALFIISVSILGYVLSWHIGAILFFRLLHGVGWGMVTTSSSTVAVASLPEEKIGSGIGLFGIASSLASVFAPNLGLQLVEMSNYTAMFLISFALAGSGCLLSLRIEEKSLRKAEAGPEKRRLIDHFFSKEAAVPAFTILCVGLGMATISNFIALYAEKIQVENIGYYFTVAGAVMLVMRPVFGKLSDSKYKSGIVFAALFGYTSVFVVLGLSRNLQTFLVAAVLYGTFYGALCPIVQTWCVKAVDASKSGTANSTYYTALDVGQGLGASLGGVLSVRFGYGNMYFFMILPQICAILLIIVSLFLRPKRRMTQM